MKVVAERTAALSDLPRAGYGYSFTARRRKEKALADESRVAVGITRYRSCLPIGWLLLGNTKFWWDEPKAPKANKNPANLNESCNQELWAELVGVELH
ncbi:hypothetical protein CEXT_199591 [Caerostris extrusa]|uniref:Uncharacterized protein n=1 Tax=Caerostris extrusa TaxID=172846 RepID=A0AAV4MTJ9_CAEEX|nr:hypothetical protein CEXT_199591 [Caerostris extrusa]